MKRTIPATVELTTRRILGGVWCLQALLIALLALSTVGFDVPLIRPLVAVAYLTLVPGTVAVLWLNVSLSNSRRAAVYVAGLSFAALMAVGGAVSLAYPPIGVDRPISVWPLALTLLALVMVISGYVARARTVSYRLPVGPVLRPVPLALLLLPFISVFGTYVYVRFGNNIPLLWLLVGIGIAPVVVAARGRDGAWYGLAIWSLSVALLYHAGIWPFGGGHPGFVMTMEQGRWLPNAVEGRGSLLPNGVLFPVYAVVADLTVEAQWTLVNTFFVSLLPLAMYETFRTQIGTRRAFISTCIFVFAYPFYTLYPGAGRAATPVLFLAMLGVAFTDESISERLTALLTLVFGASLVVSHYGTAYVVMFALLMGAIGYLLITVVDSVAERFHGGDHALATALDESPLSVPERAQVRLFRVPFLTFYTTIALGWYLYTAKGVKYQQLPTKVADAIYGVMYQEASGSAANVVSKEYGSQIVATTRLFYIFLGAMMALGFLYVAYQRFVKRERPVSDQFFALAGGHFMILGGSALPSGTGFAVARVMMIVFTFALPFALFGVDGIRETFSTVTERVSVPNPFSETIVTSLFTLVVCVFLLMNSGVVAEAVQQDYAPSTKVSGERLANSDNPYERARATQCRECDINTHIWVYSHANRSSEVYGDEYVESQTDFYASDISGQINFTPGPNYYSSVWSARNGTDQSSLIVLLPRNTDTGGVYEGKYLWHHMDGLRSVYSNSSLVYRSTETRIYYTQGNETAPVNE